MRVRLKNVKTQKTKKQKKHWYKYLQNLYILINARDMSCYNIQKYVFKQKQFRSFSLGWQPFKKKVSNVFEFETRFVRAKKI